MATAIHERIGECDCPGCGKQTPVKKTAGGKIKVACGWCDFETYYHPGTISHKNLMAKVRLDQAPAPAPAAGTAGSGDAGPDKSKEPALAGEKLPWER